jgi:hypothetical protein
MAFAEQWPVMPSVSRKGKFSKSQKRQSPE